MPAPVNYNGVLRINEIFRGIRNMIIWQRVYGDNIASGYKSLVDRARVEGSMYGDTMLYYATDALETKPYLVDTVNQLNLLAVARPKDPACQALTMDVFRYIEVTTDDYFTKRAWSNNSTFSEFNAVTIGWMRETKKIYDEKIYNTYVGTVETSEGKQSQAVDFTDITAPETTIDQEAKNRLVVEKVAEKIADIEVGLKDVTRDWNDYGYYRSFDISSMNVVWNSKWVNFLRKVGAPTIFNNSGLLNIKEENILPAHYFGTINADQKVADEATRSLVEQTIGDVHYWPGEAIAVGATVPAGKSYQETPDVLEDGSVICKIIHKDSIPYMSAFQSEKEFINVKNLSTNHYLHFGHNTLQYLYNYPLITVKADTVAE